MDENFSFELSYKHVKYMLQCDSRGVIHLAKNSIFQSHTTVGFGRHLKINSYNLRKFIPMKIG